MINLAATEDGDPVMQFTDVQCAEADVELRPGRNGWSLHVAEIRCDERKSKGDEIEVSFAARSQGYGSQLIVDDEVAIASWTAGWHPFTNPSTAPGVSFHAGTLHAPGRTRLELPAGWIGLVDGTLVERSKTDEGTIEIWETPDKIARSFAAGPYTVATHESHGRAVNVYMQSEDKEIGPERLARLVFDAMAAQEERLGPFPFDSYSVVEIPWTLPGQTWGAASQQTFIIARRAVSTMRTGNLPLWAHELAHGWWGNAVGHRGTGAMWCGETLAQLGALISIEALEGPEALQDFLAFSRVGYSPTQCAAGYFALWRWGQDQPIAQLGNGFTAHELADSKGMWVYHMLRHEIGEESFYRVLRNVIEDFTHSEITVDILRQRFEAAAPEHDLDAFFEQWLDRTGAPVLDVDWYAKRDGKGLVIEVNQVQDLKPFEFDLEVEIELRDGESLLETLEVTEASHSFMLETPSRPADIRLDPNSKILMWRPEYGPRPGAKLVGMAVPEDVLEAVVGHYRNRGNENETEVFAKDGQLFARMKGTPALPLLYQGGASFQVDVPGSPLLAEFDLSTKPAAVLKSIEGGKEFFADRIEK